MKLIGRINLTKQEILDIIFRHETVSIDPQIVQKFNDKKPCMVDIEKINELLAQQKEENTQQSKLSNQSQLNSDKQYIRAFLVVLLLQLVGKKGGVRLDFVNYLVSVVNSDFFLQNTEFATQPWTVLSIFFPEFPLNSEIEKIDGFKGFPGVSESEMKIVIKNLEKIYTFALSFRHLDTVQKYMSMSNMGYAFYCESGLINTEFLQLFEKKSSFQRNVSIVSSILSNLLLNSNMKKTSASKDDTTWVELCGQTRQSINSYLNFLVEELGVEDIEGLKLKGSFDRTPQTLNNLSLQLASNLSQQVQNTLTRISQQDQGQKTEDFTQYLNENLANLHESCQNNLKSLQYTNENSSQQGLGAQLPYILSIQHYTEPLRQAIELEVFSSFVYLFYKNKALNPEKKKQQEPEKQEEQKEDNKKNKKVKAPKVKKLGFGLGTAQIFDLFLAKVQFEESAKAEESFKLLISQFFNVQNKDLLALLEELTVSKNSERRKVKIAKGAQDFGGEQMALRRNIFDTVSAEFRAHGAVEIDTPVFELKETLTGKYGEDSKLIYDLEDQGGELLSLRYDLTVPFARFMAQSNIPNIKRYQIQKVYRRDQPNIKRGRYREFFQCDFDISGKGDSMLQDAEVISVYTSILNKLKLDNHIVKINNRKILDAMIEISGAPMNKFKTICSAIDKLDKETWETVYKELVEDKGIDVNAVEKLGTFVKGDYTGKPMEILQKIRDAKLFEGSTKGVEALNEMQTLFEYFEMLDCDQNISFDLSLARGLDYYTGMIFEIVLVGAEVGSIAAGGRYDELIGMFMDKKDAVPSVGGSLGIERVYRILEARKEMKKFTETEVLVCTIGSLSKDKLKICGELWKAGIKAEYLYKDKDKTQRQLEYANKKYIPFTIFIGEDEIQNNKIALKNMYQGTQKTLERSEYISVLQKDIEQYYQDVQKPDFYIRYDEMEAKAQEKDAKKGGKKE